MLNVCGLLSTGRTTAHTAQTKRQNPVRTALSPSQQIRMSGVDQHNRTENTNRRTKLLCSTFIRRYQITLKKKTTAIETLVCISCMPAHLSDQPLFSYLNQPKAPLALRFPTNCCARGSFDDQAMVAKQMELTLVPFGRHKLQPDAG